MKEVKIGEPVKSNLQWSGLNVKIVSNGDLDNPVVIKNSEDKTKEIVEKYIKNNLTEEIERKFNWEVVPKIKKEVDEKVRQESNKMFTLFWIFASVVAFLLVEVQVLKTATSWNVLAWLSLILLWALSFFMLLIKIVLLLRENFSYKEDKIWIFIVAVLLITSILFIGFWVCLAWEWKEWQNWTIKYEKNFYSDIRFR